VDTIDTTAQPSVARAFNFSANFACSLMYTDTDEYSCMRRV
jgi:hypothetical protein